MSRIYFLPAPIGIMVLAIIVAPAYFFAGTRFWLLSRN